MLDMSREALAKSANVAERTIADFEGGRRQPIPATLAAIRAALEAAGIQFVAENGGGAGVRFKYNRKDARHIARFESEGGPAGEDDVQ